jgi:hypothetical protein
MESNAGERAYSTTTTVTRNGTEAYRIEAWTIGEQTLEASRAYTYNRTHGLYKLTAEDTPAVVEAFDEALATVQEPSLATSAFERTTGQAYELLIDVVDPAEVLHASETYEHNHAVTHVTVERSPAVVETIDESIDSLRRTVGGS